MVRHQASLLLLAALLYCLVCRVGGQYRESTEEYTEVMEKEQKELQSDLESEPYVDSFFNPDHQFLNTDYYIFDYPDASSYKIGVIVDPCKSNSYDCCNSTYGAPEYAILLETPDDNYRVVAKQVFAESTEILDNVLLIDESGDDVARQNSRIADDVQVIDDLCVGNGVPESYCVGFRQKMQRSTYLPPCVDNNSTVDALSPCYDLDGTQYENCMAVAYSQTAFNVMCGGVFEDHSHCGTFLEVHMAYSNNYADTTQVLGEVRVDLMNVSGYTTTTLPLTWQKNASQILCAYEHNSYLAGTMVLISSDAPTCCCPRKYSAKDKLGSFVCPAYVSGSGPFAIKPLTVADNITFEDALEDYPYCPWLDDDQDSMQYSALSAAWGRAYTRAAQDLQYKNNSQRYTSDDVKGSYREVCPYFSSCGRASAATTSGDPEIQCDAGDWSWTFAGYVGKIVSVPTTTGGQYEVTFNDGRTTYMFQKSDMILEVDHNYEIWWVQRTRYDFIVQKRKPFKVSSPACTFDTINDRPFPYTRLDADGNAID